VSGREKRNNKKKKKKKSQKEWRVERLSQNLMVVVSAASWSDFKSGVIGEPLSWFSNDKQCGIGEAAADDVAEDVLDALLSRIE
jgi:hypothetical protein